MVNSAERSSILLLCLGAGVSAPDFKNVNVAELRGLFGEFGHVLKVVIFAKKTVLKAFVEFADDEQAALAKRAFHNKAIKHYGRAKLYFSPNQTLNFSNRFIEFWEEACTKKQEVPEHNISTGGCSRKSDAESKHTNLPGRNNFLCEGGREVVTSISQMFAPSVFPINKSSNSENVQIDLHSPYQPKTDRFSSNFGSSTRPNKESIGTRIDMCHNCEFVDNFSRPSKVVNVHTKSLLLKTANEMFNLFSAFGNIEKIVYAKNCQKALIEFTTVMFASEAVTYLNDLVLTGSRLKVGFSEHQTIDLSSRDVDWVSTPNYEIFLIPNTKRRYRTAMHPTISPVSSCLLVIYPQLEGVQSIDVYLAIQKYSKPIKTQLMSTKNQNDAQNVVSMLFSFEDVQASVGVLAKFHNRRIKGAQLSIFFF